jgi:pimeloyl-ACP methyl ester carboxylesterase
VNWIDHKARRLVVPGSYIGRAIDRLLPSAERLIARGHIDARRRVAGYEGIEIDAWLIRAHGRSPRGSVLMLHPLMMTKRWLLPAGRRLAQRGFDVVLPDLRAHGGTGGQFTTWGCKEKHDIKLLVDALLTAGDIAEPIYAVGTSLGGATAIQWAAIDRRCRGVLALAPPASFWWIGRRVLLLESRRTVRRAVLRAAEMAGFNPYEASAAEAAGRLTCPLVLVHGVLDFIVPFPHIRAVATAGWPRTQRLIRPFASHTPDLGRWRWLVRQFEQLVGRPRAA